MKIKDLSMVPLKSLNPEMDKIPTPGLNKTKGTRKLKLMRPKLPLFHSKVK